jgi:hypothetical protein
MRWPSEIPQLEPCEPDLGTPEDWERIERALGFEDFDPRRRERLWRDLAVIFNVSLSDERMGVPNVRAANYRRALQVLRRHAVRLFVDLSPSGDLGGSVEGTIDGVLHRRPVCDPEDAPTDGLNELDQGALVLLSLEILPHDKLQALLEGLAELIAAVDRGSEALPRDRGGQHGDQALHAVIFHLARFYNDKSRRKPGVSRHWDTGQPSGPFFRFVQDCLQIFEPNRARSDEALAKTIQRVLKRYLPIR